MGLHDHVVVDHQGIEAGRVENRNGVLKRMDDRLSHYVEARVQDDRDAGQPAKLRDKCRKAFVPFWPDALHAAGAVGVNHAGDLFGCAFAKAQGLLHVAGGSVFLEILGAVRVENRRGERAELLAKLDAGAQLLAQGKVVGWVQGRAEFGPRALGNRSFDQALLKHRLRRVRKVGVAAKLRRAPHGVGEKVAASVRRPRHAIAGSWKVQAIPT
jgi:hypothetical protein